MGGPGSGKNKGPGPLQRRVSPEVVHELARLGCTQIEVARRFGCHAQSFNRLLKDNPKLREAWDAGKADGDEMLRRLQWRHAKMPNGSGVQMTIHMSRHRLGEHDKALVQAEVVGRVDVIHQLLKEIDGTTRGLPPHALPPGEVIDGTARPTSLLPDPAKIPERQE
jgi:hypothetical protein